MPGENRATLLQPAEVADEIAALCEPGETRHGEVVRFSRAAPA
jgi:hypothetical protein